ncbi:hypothetical protein B4U80_01460 [Leptotrombidium deliense]|uniref:RNA methyltransferase-like protein n=1 Tax=Leptotrombidium deliense TaxID=299467 RepID=A0A443SW26_9ACAR|nr:hypothetical protein B4U80_01460 [Leptotrombidium deliense]
MSAAENVKNWREHKCGRLQTLSIAIPASILDNAQSKELRFYLVGQIARAAAIFNCDEIIIYDEFCHNVNEDEYAYDKRTRSIAQMAKILQYLECPQYLRKYFFPIQKDLEYVGLLNPLDTKHHFRISDNSRFREGVVVEKKVGENVNKGFANVGLRNDIKIDRALQPGVRVTVELDIKEGEQKKKLSGKIVSPNTPRVTAGIYWGYSVRIAKSLSDVFKHSSFDEDYDLTIGTSEKGDDVDSIIDTISSNYKHALIVFGGLKGIEAAMDSDVKYQNIDSPKEIFNYYLNTCPGQGSNTIRTEEAILITLSAFRSKLFNFTNK